MEVYQEKVGDLPLISYYIDQSNLVDELNNFYPLHGNWSGPPIGQLVKGWLLYIISECDHRLYTVEDWSRLHLQTLRVCLGCPDLEASAFQDDRLGKLLELFSQDTKWSSFQSSYNKHLLRLYSLETQTLRVDSVNVPSYRSNKVGSLFQYGHHKSHQAHTAQLKTMLVTLDPLSLPLCTYTVEGNRSDEVMYVPAIKQAQSSLTESGLLYVGDSKMANPTTSAYLASGGNYYLNPLSPPYFRKNDLEQGLDIAFCDASNIVLVTEKEEKTKEEVLIAKVYELPSRERFDEEQDLKWNERLILILSPQHAKQQIQDLEERLSRTHKALLERFLPRRYRKVWLQDNEKDEKKAQDFVDKLLEKERVKEYLDVQIIKSDPQSLHKQTKDNPIPLSIRVKPIEEAIKKDKNYAGWRAYGTNAPTDRLPAEEVLKCYREQFRIEHQFHRLLTKTTDLLPIYLKDEERIRALIKLLILALQFVCIIQCIARKTLNDEKLTLNNLVPGNKGRKVEKPTTEALLKRFNPIGIVWVKLPNQNAIVVLTNFDPIHQQILYSLKCPQDIYLTFSVLFNMSMNLVEQNSS